jgi:anti-sigma factor RsiW
MNDRRFIELLNLYVDQELTEDDARELEQEIAQRPDRRRVYSQYCRMQRACVRLLEQQAAPAPRIARITHAATSQSGADRVPATILQLPPMATPRRQRGLGWAGWSGSALAAAACVALAFVVLRQPVDVGGSSAVASTPVPAVAAAPAEPASVVPSSSNALAAARSPAPAYRPVVSVNVLLRSNDGRFAQTGGGLTLDQSSLDWQQQLRLTPIRQMQFEPSPFQSTGGLRAVEAGALATDRMDQPVPAHLITFEFRR